MTTAALHLIDSLCCASLCTGAGGPGACVMIVRGDDVVFEKSYGLADIPSGKPIDADCSFCLASVSKQFTSCAVLQLCEKGALSLEDEVTKHFPEYSSEAWIGVKIKHLLSHSSGIPSRPQYLSREQKVFADEDRSVEYFKSLGPRKFSPGTAYDYQNATYVLLGKLIERISGQKFEDYMYEHVLRPAGMEKAVYFDRNHQDRIPSKATGYRRTSEGWEKHEFGTETFFATRPDGGLYCSPREFVKWEMSLRSCLDGQGFLGRESLLDAMREKVSVSGSPYCDYENYPGTSYGYGWFIRKTAGGQTVIYHTGDNGGFTIMAARYPASDELILIFANFPDWDRAALIRQIEGALFLKVLNFNM